jgi:hypothetical protein
MTIVIDTPYDIMFKDMCQIMPTMGTKPIASENSYRAKEFCLKQYIIIRRPYNKCQEHIHHPFWNGEPIETE